MAACVESINSASDRKGANIGSTDSSAVFPRPVMAVAFSPVAHEVEARVLSCWNWYCWRGVRAS